MRWPIICVFIVAFSVLSTHSYSGPAKSTDQAAKVGLTIIKYVDFSKALKAHEGKVIVVYLWGDYSLPDRKRLLDVVEMHKRLEKKPIAFMTVCHSPVAREDAKQLEVRRMHNLKFLTNAKAGMQNFLLDENDEVWAAKLNFVSGPTFIVYDPRGKKAKTYSFADGVYRLEEVENLLIKLAVESGKPSAK